MRVAGWNQMAGVYRGSRDNALEAALGAARIQRAVERWSCRTQWFEKCVADYSWSLVCNKSVYGEYATWHSCDEPLEEDQQV